MWGMAGLWRGMRPSDILAGKDGGVGEGQIMIEYANGATPLDYDEVKGLFPMVGAV